MYFTIPKRTATQSNPSCRNLHSKSLIYKGKFEKIIQKWELLKKKADKRKSTKLFKNPRPDSDSATQNSLRTVGIQDRIHFIWAEINFDRKRRIGHTVRFIRLKFLLWAQNELYYMVSIFIFDSEIKSLERDQPNNVHVYTIFKIHCPLRYATRPVEKS